MELFLGSNAAASSRSGRRQDQTESSRQVFNVTGLLSLDEVDVERDGLA